MVQTADDPTSKLKLPDTKTLNEISARLFSRADEIHQVTLADLAHDIRIAALAYGKLASIRVELSAIAEQTSDAHAAREIRDILDDAERVSDVEGAANPAHSQALGYEALTLLSDRLRQHAEALVPSGRQHIVTDIRLGALAAVRLAGLRFDVAEIAQKFLDNPHWDAGAVSRDLREALSRAESGAAEGV
jgi:hypothetical protein